MQSERSTPTAHRVMSDGLYTFALRAVNVAAAALLGIATARLLGPAGKGLYALPMIQSALVATTFGGLTSATSYYLLNAVTSPREVLKAALRAAALFVVGGAACIALIGVFGKTWWTIAPAIASLPPLAAINIVAGYVIGVHRVRLATTLTVAATACNLVLVTAGLFLIAKTPPVAIAAWLISLFLAASVALAYTIAHAWRAAGTGEALGLSAYLRLSGKVGAVGVVTLLNYRADLYVVALLLSPAALGLYSVAVSAAESLLVPTQIAALVTSPYVGSLPPDRAASVAARCVRNNLLIALVVCVTLFALAPFLVRLLYGAAFVPLVPALRVLLLGVVALSLGSPVSNYFTLKLAKPEVMLWLATASAAICIGVSFALVPRFGLVGAAWASTIAYVVGQVGGLAFFCRTTGVGWPSLLVPTRADFLQYWEFFKRVLADRSFAAATEGRLP